jgi:aspartate/glutamate racemase
MDFIYYEAKTWTRGANVAPLLELASILRDRGADVVIAGCTEVEMCLAKSGEDRPGFIFPLRVVAEHCVGLWDGSAAPLAAATSRA